MSYSRDAHAVALACCLMLGGAATHAWQPDQGIPQAIAHGLKVKGPTYLLMGGVNAPHYHVIVTSPYARIATAAGEAAAQYRDFTPADVTPEMASPTLDVTVTPGKPFRGQGIHGLQWWQSKPIKAVVIRPKDGKALTPSNQVRFPVTFENTASGSTPFQAEGLTLRFELASLPLNRDLEVIVFSEGGEQVSPLKIKDLARIHVRP